MQPSSYVLARHKTRLLTQVTGKKLEQKLYRRHSGYYAVWNCCLFHWWLTMWAHGMFNMCHCRYTGNLKETTMKDMLAQKPTEARFLEHALDSHR
jgi:ribosomal protein L13